MILNFISIFSQLRVVLKSYTVSELSVFHIINKDAGELREVSAESSHVDVVSVSPAG